MLFKKKRAIGVEFLKEGETVRAYARKKVIISAGINSAQLLMLSGIGTADLLNNADIPVIFDNPNVGQNLKNHTLNFAVFPPIPIPKITQNHLMIPMLFSQEVLSYLIQRQITKSQGGTAYRNWL